VPKGEEELALPSSSVQGEGQQPCLLLSGGPGSSWLEGGRGSATVVITVLAVQHWGSNTMPTLLLLH